MEEDKQSPERRDFFMNTHFQWMQRALYLAAKGQGFTSPNPMVGAVLVKNNQIIGEGYHQKFGGPHAEIVALQQAGNAAKGATLYVTLEPCSHHGKTPPCAPRIIQAGISEVHVSMIDPNPLVNRKGIRMLENAGIPVHTGLMEDEARRLNRGFISLVTQKRPWITLKMAQSADGYIADITGKSKWITSPPAREFVMSQRTLHDGIMVGLGTVLKDNPGLLPTERTDYIPWRIILDDVLRIPESSQVISDDFHHRTLILTTCDENKDTFKRLMNQGVQILSIPEDPGDGLNITKAIQGLADFGVSSVFCEGGSLIAGKLIRHGLVDELQLFIAPRVLGKGTSTFGGFMKTLEQAIHLTWEETQMYGPDILIRGRLA